MRATDAYSDLQAIGRPVIRTREAAARLGITPNAATQLLRSTDDAGLTRHLRRGLWALDPRVDPLVAAPYLTAPYPAYVSSWSALARHEMIEQIPAAIHVATPARSRTVETPVGTFSLHHLTPELFDGFDGSPSVGYLAGPEKALFDLVYTRAPQGGRAHFPELTLPERFDLAKLEGWVRSIASSRLRTLVARGLAKTLENAERQANDSY